MKKQLLFAASLVASLSANACGFILSNVHGAKYQGKNYADWGKLQLVGNQLSDKDGNSVQLKGWSTFSLHDEDSLVCLGKDQWSQMQKYGANVVRLAMYVDKKGSYLSDTAKFQNIVKKCIAEIAAQNMYCIVDWNISEYESDSTTGDPNKYLQESKNFFSEISKYCAKNKFENVIYEICSEPICGWTNMKSYSESVIPVITANQPDAIIIVGTDSWSQKILEPTILPIDSAYKKNVMYSFHYQACNHFNLLGDFRAAQKQIPVFASEWSAHKWDHTGSYCHESSDAFALACDSTNEAPQAVSWCLWNWGNGGDAASFFDGSCSAGNESKTPSDNNSQTYGNYVMELMGGVATVDPDSIDPDNSAYYIINKIPSTPNLLWQWAYYDYGGEGYAYHDENSSAYKKIKRTGDYVDYAIGDECDAYSVAYSQGLLDKKNHWYTLSEDGKTVVDYSDSVKYEAWDGSVSYLSLNGGKKYDGIAGSGRPDEGVDLVSVSGVGTEIAYKGYNNLCLVENGEWINYTVDVAEPGYYKIDAYVSKEAEQGEISFYQENCNITRSRSDIHNSEDYPTIHFDKPIYCAEDSVDERLTPWDCWDLLPALDYDDEPNGAVAFAKAGVQKLRVQFNGPAGGIGPLVFTKIDNALVETTDAVATGAFTISPNPTTGEFNVTLTDGGKAHVDVINVAGQVVYSAEFEGSAMINKALSAGVYSVVVKSNNSVKAEKLVVK